MQDLEIKSHPISDPTTSILTIFFIILCLPSLKLLQDMDLCKQMRPSARRLPPGQTETCTAHGLEEPVFTLHVAL